jgi:hypothetical protein
MAALRAAAPAPVQLNPNPIGSVAATRVEIRSESKAHACGPREARPATRIEAKRVVIACASPSVSRY